MGELKNPITFQCVECGVIVTDSFFLIERVKNFLLFTDAPNTQVNEEIHRPKEKEESLCSYHKVFCACGKEIGRRYASVNTDMPNYLGKFLIPVENIRGHQLGVSKQDENSIATHTEMWAEILRLQKFCTYLYGKIKENPK
ncbi:hypothetical protein NEFER03_0335 [Nematocida sp. LUAm3]|nr:hypothetical protein NEFER03_0335 [Nematocida sp. LUAm3]KAI5173787.1 hypothetical protein NEFER02_0303 [Nematocida sp. LUAm2]KAI5177010.1 hypothetical protein NEFER01_0335 [Nematocida sp. LUAm1]